jgi:hypothetical protein
MQKGAGLIFISNPLLNCVKKDGLEPSQCVDKPRTDQLDFVVRARIRTVAQFEIANYRRFPATVRPEADN